MTSKNKTASAHAEALRSYHQAMIDFVRFNKQITKYAIEKKSIKITPTQKAERERLIQALRTRRRPALVAGVKAGESIKDMDNLLDEFFGACLGYELELQRHCKERPRDGWNYPLMQMVNQYAVRSRRIEDLIAISEEKINKGSNGGRKRLYDKHAEIAVRMRKDNPRTDRLDMEKEMKNKGLTVPMGTKKKSMWESICKTPAWKKVTT